MTSLLNGKRRYHTWLVKVNMDNVRATYEDIISRKPEEIKAWTYKHLMNHVKNFYQYHDAIEWDYVDFEEIREHMIDTIEELRG